MHLFSLSAVTWDFPLVGRTRMLTEAWRAAGAPTTFVQVPGLRTLEQRLTGRVREPDPPGLVVRPLPAPPARLWTALGEGRVRALTRAQARTLNRRLDAIAPEAERVALVISPVWAPWLERLRFGAILYDCIDDPDIHAPRPALVPMMRRWERELIDRSSAAVVTAEGLAEHCNRLRPDLPTHLVRNGVDAGRFRKVAADEPRPADMPNPDPARPIVGFVGALYEWIDWTLIDRVTRAMPEARFVFVGPHAPDAPVRELAKRDNVSFLGPRAYAEVPRYMAAFDAAWVPFDASRVSSLANPIKIYEYLALGLPVVTTPVADADELRAVCSVATGASAVTEALRAALTDERTRAGAAARQAFADAHTWRARADDLWRVAQQTLDAARG